MKIEIYQKEIEALDTLLKDAKVLVSVGYVLGTLRIRIQEALNKEQENKLKEHYNGKSKDNKKKQ